MNDASHGRIAVVTGAGRGLGQTIALALARAGHGVAVVARSAEQLQQTVRLISDASGTGRAFIADVSSEASVAAMAAAVGREMGPVDILINAAGVFGPIQLIQESDPSAWLATVSINLFGPYLTCRAFIGSMVKRGWGRVVNLSSAAALHPPGPLNSAYATSKVALNQLTRHLAAEVMGTGVTANVIHPGDVKTEMWAEIRDQAARSGPQAEGYRQWVEWVEKTGGDPPQKAADLILRLCGDDAASISGQFLWIDGGLQAPIPSWEPPQDQRPWR